MQKKETKHQFQEEKRNSYLRKHIQQRYSFIGTRIILVVYNKDLAYQEQNGAMSWELKSGFRNPSAQLQQIKFNADRSNTHYIPEQ